MWPTSAKNLTETTEQLLTDYVLLYNSDLTHTGDLFSQWLETTFQWKYFFSTEKKCGHCDGDDFLQHLFPTYKLEKLKVTVDPQHSTMVDIQANLKQ